MPLCVYLNLVGFAHEVCSLDCMVVLGWVFGWHLLCAVILYIYFRVGGLWAPHFLSPKGFHCYLFYYTFVHYAYFIYLLLLGYLPLLQMYMLYCCILTAY